MDDAGNLILDPSGNPVKCPVVDGTKEATDATSTTQTPVNLDADAVAAVVDLNAISVTDVASTGFTTMKEGFVGANTNYGQSSKYSLTNKKGVNTSSWFSPNLTYKKGGKEGKAVQNILNRQKQPVPLPEGQLLMFANTPFKPECCPNAYSNSMGCACMTVDQYNYLIDRGGNNVPYSEY
jgi:hypothetical protein